MDPFIGQVMIFGGNFAPRGWAFCEGQLLPIAQNTALFSILGTTYGGDGRTTFGLPNLSGRTVVHEGRGPGLSQISLGEQGGKETHTLTIEEMPTHNHLTSLTGQIACNEEDGDDDDPQGRNFGVAASGTPYNTNANNKVMGPNSVSVTGKTGTTGNEQSFNIRNPYLGVKYIIALVGTYPSRS